MHFFGIERILLSFWYKRTMSTPNILIVLPMFSCILAYNKHQLSEIGFEQSNMNGKWYHIPRGQSSYIKSQTICRQMGQSIDLASICSTRDREAIHSISIGRYIIIHYGSLVIFEVVWTWVCSKSARESCFLFILRTPCLEVHGMHQTTHESHLICRNFCHLSDN